MENDILIHHGRILIRHVINYRFSTNLFTLTKYESNMASIRVQD